MAQTKESKMKLYDYHRVFGLTSFNGGMPELQCRGVTKSFQKAKKQAIAEVSDDIKDLKERLLQLENLNESDVECRGEF